MVQDSSIHTKLTADHRHKMSGLTLCLFRADRPDLATPDVAFFNQPHHCYHCGRCIAGSATARFPVYSLKVNRSHELLRLPLPLSQETSPIGYVLRTISLVLLMGASGSRRRVQRYDQYVPYERGYQQAFRDAATSR